MKSFHYPFIIGEYYEKWEFDLVILDEERVKGCDSYIYLRPIFIANVKVNKVELVFSFDVLIGIYLKFSKKAFNKVLKNERIIKGYNVDRNMCTLYYQI
ncbi:hypothetical protein [Elizabethkingia anophelis]|uniref:hypothetical protein n=1 Tax=Elizabethkingia anophelis TaxID=1117645 RepID=UPI003892C43D